MIAPAEDTDRPRGLLSRADREFLLASDEERSENYTRQGASTRERAIKERVQNGLRDFQLLAKHLPAEQRDEIFEVEWGSREHGELEQDVVDAIQFIYAGMGGQTWFGRVLKTGVRNGENELGYVRNALDVSIDFEVEYPTLQNRGETVAHVENEEWDELSPADLLAFIRLAKKEGGLDLAPVEEELGMREWSATYIIGKKRRRIPNGKWTPSMDPAVFDQWRFSELSGDDAERKLKALFGEGVGSGSFAVFDGEKVFDPPTPGTDEDAEVLYYVDEQEYIDA